MAARLSVALALALASGAARAAAPWDGPPLAADPAALLEAARALPEANGTAVDVLLEEATWTFDARGAATFTYHLLFRPLVPDAARRWVRAERSWSPWHQAPPEIRARVISPDGAVHELDPRTVAEQAAGGGEVASDRRLLAGALAGVRPGAIVEEVSVVRDLEPLFDGGVVARFWLAQPNAVRISRLRIEAPEALPLRFVVRGADVRPAVRVEGGVRTISLERRNVPPAPRAEPDGPRDVPHAPVVLFGWGRSWRDAAERYGALCRRQLGREPLPEAARAAVRGRAGPDAIRAAVAWIHARVRPTGVELGEAAIVPATPAETVRRGRGDAKDLSLLLVAMLEEAGIGARVALLRTAWHDVEPDLPGLGLLDHAVVRVDGKDPLWIDPADRFFPPGRLPPPDQGRLALVTGPGQTGLVRTPESPAAENAATTVREIRPAELGKGRITEVRTLTGALAAAERAFRARTPREKRHAIDARQAQDVFRADVFLGAEVEGEDDPAAPLRVKVEADGSDVVVTGDDEAEIPVSPDPTFEPLPSSVSGDAEAGGAERADPPARTTDLVLALPYRWDLSYRVIPPEGFRVRLPLPPDRTERFGPASFAQAFRVEADGTVAAAFRFDTGGRRIPAADATLLARRVRELVRGRGPIVVLERTAAALLAAGKVTEGLAEIRRLVDLHPREAMHRLHLAIALLQHGFVEQAAEEARRGIALEPGRAWGHRVLGYVLEHDAVGRLHGAGFDRAGALAAYEAAREKDPQHAGGRAALASLLLHGPAGAPQGPGADVTRALAEYRAVHDELGSSDHDEGWLQALLAAGRHAEALKLARGMPPTGPRNAALIAAAAVVEGVEKADEAAAALGEARRAALREAASLLVRERRHPLAAALASRAARGAANAAELFAQADTLAALRPWEKIAAEGGEAERLVRRLLVAAVRAPDLAKEVAPLAAAGLDEPARKLLVSGLPLPPDAARAALAGSGLPPDVLLDLLLSRLELVQAGDPAAGVRVRIRVPFGDGILANAVYLVRQRGALRLVATDAAWPLLGVEARRRAEAGDLAGAARWLDWAREAAPGAAGEPASPAGVLAALWRGDAADAAQVRRAAAAVAAFDDPRGAAVPVLREARAAVRGEAERRAVELALAQALRGAGNADGALRLADEVLAGDPGSRSGFALKSWALRRLGRGAAIAPAADAFLRRTGEDPEALALVGSSFLLAGDLDAAARTFRRAIDGGRASPMVYNNAAWLELFRDPPGPSALDWARRSVEGRAAHEAALNTLAAAYAASGKPAEAREIFLRSIEGGRPLRSADWYVFGSIAETWGVSAAARAAYERALEPERQDGEDDPTAAHVLARRRLERLGTPPGPPPAGAGARESAARGRARR
jgi:tetratricopeptide (TPR) repeat protein/transglutaminase-like putative cysteine protease